MRDLKKIEYSYDKKLEIRKELNHIIADYVIDLLLEYLEEKKLSIIFEDCFDSLSGWKGRHIIVNDYDLSKNGYFLSNDSIIDFLTGKTSFENTYLCKSKDDLLKDMEAIKYKIDKINEYINCLRQKEQSYITIEFDKHLPLTIEHNSEDELFIVNYMIESLNSKAKPLLSKYKTLLNTLRLKI